MPSGERAKVLDFGLAKDAASETRRTSTGVSLGTPGYMSPEQAAGAGTVTDRSDVYSLGVMFFELLTGQAPFTANSVAALMRQHITKPPPPLPKGTPTALSALISQMLAKEPEERPTMQQVVERLDNDRATAGEQTAAPRAYSRARMLLWGSAVGLTFAAAVTGLLLKPGNHPTGAQLRPEAIKPAVAKAAEPPSTAASEPRIPQAPAPSTEPAARLPGGANVSRASRPKKSRSSSHVFPDRKAKKGASASP